MGHLWEASCRAYDTLGLEDATGGDEMFRDLVLARIIYPTSTLAALRVLDEVGAATASYPTLHRRLPLYAQSSWRQRLATACVLGRRAGSGSRCPRR
ncbi:MAG: hypothetical protein J2P19_22390 [Pseudonocardia sp.]|nr:hypothetical protein [Pseudonocardia sp.]